MRSIYEQALYDARSYLNGRGLDCPADSCFGILSQLKSLPDELMPWYAVPAANRLLRIHESQNSIGLKPFTIGWREPIDELWTAMHSERELQTYFAEILNSSYYSTAYNHFDGQDGPQDASHPPASACIYAIECALNPESKYIDLLFNLSLEYAMYELTLNDTEFGLEFEQPVSQEFLELIHPSYRNCIEWHADFLETTSRNNGRLPIDHRLWINHDV